MKDHHFTPAAVQRRLSAYRTGAAMSLAIALGDELGLFTVLARSQGMTRAELCKATACDPVLVDAWLRLQVVGGIVEEVADAGYRLPVAVSRSLARDHGLASMTGTFAAVPWEGQVFDALVTAVRTGGRLDPRDYDERYHRGRERSRAPWVEGGFGRLVLPRTQHAGPAMVAGARVADLGCGGGAVTLALARRFPASSFVGIDPSPSAVDRAEALARDAALPALSFVRGDATSLAALGPFDVVMTLDCMHEITNATTVAERVRAALVGDGTWLIEDFKLPGEGGDATDHAAMLWFSSLLVCLHSPGAPASGAWSLDPPRVRAIAEQAGFTSVRELDVGHPVYVHYEVRG